MGGRALVTGAQGFVGRHLLAELGDQAVPLEADVTDFEALAEAIRRERPSAVVHLAAHSSVASTWEREREVWLVNAVGTVNLLEAVRGAQADARVLVVSTADVYGRAEQLPTPEEAPLRPLSPYAASKAAAELAAGRARRADGLAVGSIGFFGRPDENGQVETGYGLIESARRQGLISDALTVVIAAAEAAGAQVIAHTSDDNVPSRCTLAKFGFVREDATNDDGEHRYVRPRP